MTEDRKASILVVDDESSNIISLTKTLSSEYTVRAAINGRDAIKTAEKHLPDLILLDIIMPEMDGFAVISALKASEKTKDIPVVFLTAMTSPDNESKGLRLGAADFINKPFSQELLLKRVKMHLRGHGDDSLATKPRQQGIMDDSGAREPSTSPSVLIVDDESANILSLTHILGSEYTVRAAINGPDAIKTAQQHLPDIILLDIVMPEMDGYKVLSALKGSEKTRNIPVIFISKLSVHEDEEKGLALGAADYISKPFSPAIVKLRVDNQLRMVNQMRIINAANRAKSNFLATMSHEIRTPLNAVLGLTEIMLYDDSLPEHVSDGLYRIHNSGSVLLSIINDILDLSKIEAGKLELAPSKYDVASLISDTVTLNTIHIGSKQIEFKLFVDEFLPQVLYGDEVRIKQILNNLLSNAFKYTESGEITLSFDVSEDSKDDKDDEGIDLTIKVIDTGQGMTEKQVTEMFELYSRFNYESNRAIEGTGLGMTITQNMVKLMGGDIDVESEPNKGTTFTVRLPQKRIDNQVMGKQLSENLQSLRQDGVKKVRKSNVIIEPMPYGKVLIVDDVEANLFVAKGLMLPYGLSIDTADSGFEAIKKIKDGSIYDVVFMDHMMPGMDGVQALKNIRSTGYSQPVVALTANALKGQQELFLTSGFDEFISKPIDRNQLNDVLNKYVRDKQPPEVIERLRAESEKARALLSNPSSNDVIRRYNARQAAVLPGLDVRSGIIRFGGSEDDYSDVLRSYARSTPVLLDAIKQVSAETLNDYAVTTHGIKGSCFGIFADALGREAEALEEAAIAGDYEFVSANNHKFINSVSRLVTDIESWLASRAAGQKPVCDKPDEALLSRLVKACDSSDIDAMDMVMSEIESFEYTSDNGLVAWLRENLDQGKYRLIAESFDF